MATSLVSTGVQFPDATIQTTAAAGTPGATTQYSIIQGYNADPFLIKPTDLATGSFTAGAMQTRATDYIVDSGTPIWSSFYGKWFSLVQTENAGSSHAILSSSNGVSWNTVLNNIYSVSSTPNAGINEGNSFGGASMAIDDTNGRVFIVYTYSGIGTRVLYSNPSSSNWYIGWTNTTILSNGTRSSVAYVKMATTGASGIVVYSFDNTSYTFNVITCSAGSTTFTNRFSASSPTAVTGTIKYEESGKIAVYLNSIDRVLYTTSGNITTGWTQNSAFGSTSPSSKLGDVGGGYFVTLYNEYEIMYSTTGAGTWTRVVLDASGNNQISCVVFMGTYWAAFTNTGVVYTTATTNPSLTWTATTNAQINRFVPLNTTGTFYGKRVTAT